MKKSTYHILCSWALLLCFVTGQYMVYAHQHNQVKNLHAAADHQCKSTSHTIVKEKCQLCDSMHHTAFELAGTAGYQTVLVSTDRIFKSSEYNFTSIALILAAGRAPPVASS